MRDTLIANEPVIRLGFSLGIFAALALLEALLPRRQRFVSRWVRWPGNLGIAALNTAVVRFLIPTAAVLLAATTQENGWGALNQLRVPGWLEVVVSVLVLDLAMYLQHVMFHAVPGLWRLHRMHHADLDFDVTTGARFHPLEMVLSLGIKLAVIMALGPPVLAVLIFEVLLNSTSMFNHSNLRITQGIDRVLRCFVVTPDMHRVHHSTVVQETNSNFGFNLPWWDRMLGTYRAQPKDGHRDMVIGIGQFRTPGDLRLDRMLTQPFRGHVGDYPFGHG